MPANVSDLKIYRKELAFVSDFKIYRKELTKAGDRSTKACFKEIKIIHQNVHSL